MCGIVGYVGKRQATPFLIEGLTKLEYRGYDSSGIAVLNEEKIRVEKCVGRLAELKRIIEGNEPAGHIGIGHTRWATHGRPSDSNAHPHTDCAGNFAVVHNGIIENYMSLKEDLIEKGHSFKSETDTEVVAHLLEEVYNGDFEASVREVLSRIEGSYALVFMSREHPDRLICTKQDNPLVIGLGEGENFIASDIPAIIARTRRTYIVNDGEMAVVKADGVHITNRRGEVVTKKVFEVNWNAEAAEKGGYEHFMLKEIHEQPKAVRDTMSPRIAKDGKHIVMDELRWSREFLDSFNKVYIVACGTAYHAGLVGKYYIEKLARIPVEVDVASEFRYRSPIIDENTLMIVVSQSGETSDTLAALKEAKRLGAKSLAVTNVVDDVLGVRRQDVLIQVALLLAELAAVAPVAVDARVEARRHAHEVRRCVEREPARLDAEAAGVAHQGSNRLRRARPRRGRRGHRPHGASLQQGAGGGDAALQAVDGDLVQMVFELQDGQGGHVNISHEKILHHMRVTRGTFRRGVSRNRGSLRRWVVVPVCVVADDES